MAKSSEKDPVADRIVDLCFQAFNQEGFKRTSMDLVARELRISKKTIYKRFSSKEEILERAIRVQLDQIQEQLMRGPGHSGNFDELLRISRVYRGFLTVFSTSLIEELQAQFPHLLEWVQLMESQNFRKAISKQFKALRAAGKVMYSMNSRELALGYLAMMKGLHELPLDHSEAVQKIFYGGLSFGKLKKPKKKGI